MKTLLRATSAMPLAALALAAFSAPAYAQSASSPAPAAEADDAAPGEIVVTAQKRSENLHDVPVAVSVLSGESLAQAARPSIESAATIWLTSSTKRSCGSNRVSSTLSRLLP